MKERSAFFSDAKKTMRWSSTRWDLIGHECGRPSHSFFCIREKSRSLLHQEGNLCISDDYCFDGIEENSTVAIGAVGGSQAY